MPAPTTSKNTQRQGSSQRGGRDSQGPSRSKGKMSFASSSAPQQQQQKKRARFEPEQGDASSASYDEDDDDDDELGEGEASGPDSTDDEIDAAKRDAAVGAKAKGKTAKRKRRAIDPTAFGEALDAFLGDDGGDDEQSGVAAAEGASTTSQSGSRPQSETSSAVSKKPSATPGAAAPIFALAPSVRSRISSTTLSAKAARVALEERRARESRWRVRDVIGGWGRPGQRPGEEEDDDDDDDNDEQGTSAAANGQSAVGSSTMEWQQQGGSKGYERKLRKVAQRGVVKLFNAIRAAQSTTRDDLPTDGRVGDAATSQRAASTGKAAAPNGDSLTGRNALGGKSRELADLSKANFLDLIRTSNAAGAPKTAAAR
ncbi:unnamed protein product [Parajaminaea phylloscopi]